MKSKSRNYAWFITTALLVVLLPFGAAAQDDGDAGGEAAEESAATDDSSDDSSETKGMGLKDESDETGETPAGPESYRVDGKILVFERGGTVVERFGLPCEGQESIHSGDRLFVACGDRGLLILSVEAPRKPTQIGFRDVGGPVAGVFEANGRVWARVERVEARPVDGPGQVTAVTQASGDSDSSGADDKDGDKTADTSARDEQKSDDKDKSDKENIPVGKVVEVRPGSVVIDKGKKAGYERRDNVEMFVKKEVELGAGEKSQREDTQAVGEIVTVGETRAQVELGVNETVQKGALARYTRKGLTRDVLAPPRPSGVSSTEFMVRPFLPLQTLGLGMLGQLSYSRAFEWPGLLEVKLNPLSFAVASQENALALGGKASLSYDIRAFRIGLGVGVARLSDRSGRTGEVNRTANLNVTQVIRFGARDGLHFKADNSFLIDDDRWVYGGTMTQIQVPLKEVFKDTSTWFIARGGGHISGQALGEVGMRFLTSGNGGPGSMFLTTTLGGAGLFGPNTAYAGPLLGLGLEWRN